MTPFGAPVRRSGLRWPVGSAIQASEDEVGLDRYEARGRVGCHQRATMRLLAPHCLVRPRRRLGGESPALTVARVRGLLPVSRPRTVPDAETALGLIAHTPAQNDKAYCSHRRRRLRRLLLGSS